MRHARDSLCLPEVQHSRERDEALSRHKEALGVMCALSWAVGEEGFQEGVVPAVSCKGMEAVSGGEKEDILSVLSSPT